MKKLVKTKYQMKTKGGHELMNFCSGEGTSYIWLSGSLVRMRHGAERPHFPVLPSMHPTLLKNIYIYIDTTVTRFC